MEHDLAKLRTFATVALGLLKLLAKVYPPLAVAVPALELLLKSVVHQVETGLADGSIVPDGAGGFVPSTNSRYDPATGRFL